MSGLTKITIRFRGRNKWGKTQQISSFRRRIFAACCARPIAELGDVGDHCDAPYLIKSSSRAGFMGTLYRSGSDLAVGWPVDARRAVVNRLGALRVLLSGQRLIVAGHSEGKNARTNEDQKAGPRRD
jgi:hypothetical protein